MLINNSNKVQCTRNYFAALIPIILMTSFKVIAAEPIVMPMIEGGKFIPVDIGQYLKAVEQNNGAIAGKKLGIETASANQVAQALPNVKPSFTYTRGTYYQQVPYTPYNTPQSNTYTLGFILEGWGKRSARAELADTQITQSVAEASNISDVVQTNALFAFIDGLRNRALWLSSTVALEHLSKISESKQDVKSVQEVSYSAKTAAIDLQFSSLQMVNYMGDSMVGLPMPIGSLNLSPATFKIDSLVSSALEKRNDILLLQRYLDSAGKNVELVKKNRNIDISPYVSYTTTPSYSYGQTNFQPQTGFSAGITIPLPVGNFLQNADTVQAANQQIDIELQLRDAKVKAKTEVMQAYLQYNAAKLRLEAARQLFNSLASSTVKNLSTVKEVLVWRESEIQLIDAMTNHAKAYINLLRVSGNYSIPTI